MPVFISIYMAMDRTSSVRLHPWKTRSVQSGGIVTL